MIDGRNVFDQPVRNKIRTFDSIRKIAAGQEDDYATGCLLDYPHFEEIYVMIAIDLIKQQALDADPKVVQQISFTGNLERSRNKTIFFKIKKVQETILDFSQEL